MVVSCDLRGVHGLSLRSPRGDGETLCSKVRSDEVQDGPSCGAKQRFGHALSPLAEAEATVYLHPPPFWCAAFREHKD